VSRGFLVEREYLARQWIVFEAFVRAFEEWRVAAALGEHFVGFTSQR
jgi:hypothetical protein